MAKADGKRGVRGGGKWVKAGKGGGVNLGGGGGWEGRGRFFFPATKAVRGNNEHGEWWVSREALSRVSVRTGHTRSGKEGNGQMMELSKLDEGGGEGGNHGGDGNMTG